MMGGKEPASVLSAAPETAGSKDNEKAKKCIARGLAIQPENKKLLAVRERARKTSLVDVPKQVFRKIKSLFE